MNIMVSYQKKNLVFSLSLILAIGFLSISFVSYYIGLNEIRNKITQNDLPLSVDNIYFDIRDELQKPIYISSFMANDYFLKRWAINGEKDTSEVIAYLKDIKEKYNALSTYFISAKTLNYYHPSGKKVVLSEDNPKDSWFFFVRDHVSEYQVNIDNDYLNSGLLTIFINYRVIDSKGVFLGIAGIGIEVDVAKSFVDRSGARFKHDIYFLDREGNLILKSNNALSQFENLYEFKPLSSQADNVLSGKRNIYEYDSSDGTRYVMTRYIKDFNWVVMVEKNDKESREEILNSLISNIVICVVVFFIVIFLTNVTLRNYQSELETAALKDRLTGLYNRHALEIIFEDLFKRLDRTPSPTCTLLLDIDYFKKFNDEFGHLLGDEILKKVALIIKKKLRASDVVCRWGGEEFLVILEQVDLSNAKIMADNIRKSIEAHAIQVDGLEYTVTVSVGVAQIEAGDTQDTIIARTDKALYLSKDRGRNCVMTDIDVNNLKNS